MALLTISQSRCTRGEGGLCPMLGPCHVWAPLGPELQPFHSSLEQCLYELPSPSTTMINKLKKQLFLFFVTRDL